MSEDWMAALAAADRLPVAAPAAGGPSGPVALTSTREVLTMIVVVEFAYACALAVTIPYGTAAVGMVIAATCLLAIWIRGRFDPETAQVRAQPVRGGSHSA